MNDIAYYIIEKGDIGINNTDTRIVKIVSPLSGEIKEKRDYPLMGLNLSKSDIGSVLRKVDGVWYDNLNDALTAYKNKFV